MIVMVPGLLAVYALAVAAAGTWWLPGAAWPRRLPRLGIAAWQVLTVTFVASVLLAGLLIAIPCLPEGVNLDAVAELRDHYSSARGIAIGSTAAAASLAAIGRLLWAAASAMAMARRRRARHDETLALVGRPGPIPGMVVLDDDRPLVYCLPSRDRVVVTSGALGRLDQAQLQAVLAHERAHLSARHHLVIMLARVLPDAFPGIRFLAVAAWPDRRPGRNGRRRLRRPSSPAAARTSSAGPGHLPSPGPGSRRGPDSRRPAHPAPAG